MKKKLLGEERQDDLIVENEFKKRSIWEFLRRNEDYIQDYQKYGGDELKSFGKIIAKRVKDKEVRNLIVDKWNLWYGVMPNPEISSEECAPGYCPDPRFPQSSISYFSDLFGKDPIGVLSPGEKISPYYGERTLSDWAVIDYTNKCYETLTEKNCPRSISIKLSIEPNDKKGDLEEKLMEMFEHAYQKVSKAQKAVLEKRPVRPRHQEFDRYIKVYDRKKANPKISWSQLAREIFPNEVHKHKSPHKGRVTEIVLPSARDKVRHYWRQAKYYIEEGGWKEL